MEEVWKGYISSRPMADNFVPQRVQNMVIREYVKSKGRNFSLSATEYYMDDCFMILDALLKEIENFGAIVFYSTHQLPQDENHRKKIFDILLESKKELHFALESISIKSINDVRMMEDLLMARELSLLKDQISL